MLEPQSELTAEEHEDATASNDAEMEAAFDDAAKGLSGETPKPDAAAKPSADPKVSPDANAFVAERTKELEAKGDEAAKPKTARELAEARATELTNPQGAPAADEGAPPASSTPASTPPKDGGKPDAQIPPAPEKALEPPAPGVTAPFQVTAEDVQFFMSHYGNAPLPEGDIPVPGGTVNIKQFVDEFPQEANAIRILGGRQAEHIIQGAVDSGYLVTKDAVEKIVALAVGRFGPVESSVQTLQAQLAAESTFRELEYPSDGSPAHTDVRQVVRAPEWKEFIAGLSPALKVVANSPDIKDTRIVLDLFKETRGAAAAAGHDAKAAEKKKSADALLTKSVRTSTGSAARTSGLSGAVDENDFEGAFNATAEKLAAKR